VCLVVDGGGRRDCWEVDGESPSKESLRGRFLIRDNEVRSNEAVGVLVGATLEATVADAKDDAGDVVEEGVVFMA
jgi:hypothetical protein